jgi:hypothetical protein
MSRRRVRFALACAACLLACSEEGERAQPAADSGSDGGGGAGMPACNAQREVFPVLCATSVCHDGALNGVDLIAPAVEQRVLDVPAAGVFCKASGLRLVDSRDPERSLLLLKLSETPPCGSSMPLGSGPSGLTSAQLDCVRSFVHTLAAR